MKPASTLAFRIRGRTGSRTSFFSSTEDPPSTKWKKVTLSNVPPAISSSGPLRQRSLFYRQTTKSCSISLFSSIKTNARPYRGSSYRIQATWWLANMDRQLVCRAMTAAHSKHPSTRRRSLVQTSAGTPKYSCDHHFASVAALQCFRSQLPYPTTFLTRRQATSIKTAVIMRLLISSLSTSSLS